MSRNAILTGIMLVLGCSFISPASYVSAQTAAEKAQQPTTYACPMHKDVRASGPGDCPKCGMALRLVTDKPAESVESNNAPADDGERPTGTTRMSSSRMPDVRVYDQKGAQKSFYTDLVKGKTVAINFIFTTCTTICPPLTATFRKVQQDLSARGLDVQL